MYKRDIILSLVSIPASDGNFKFALKDATADQLKQAIARMDGIPGNKSRIAACRKQLKKIAGGEPSMAAGQGPERVVWDKEWERETDRLLSSMESMGTPITRLSILEAAHLRDIRKWAINVAALIERELLRRGEEF